MSKDKNKDDGNCYCVERGIIKNVVTFYDEMSGDFIGESKCDNCGKDRVIRGTKINLAE